MFGSPVLEVGLGLALVYLLLSLVATTLRETLEALVRRRAQDLERALGELLDDGGDAGGMLAAFYRHPLIAALYPGALAEPRKPQRKPSYIPARAFGLALVDLAEQGLANARVRQLYDLALKVSGGDRDIVRRELETWYNDAMDRASGWYRRRTHAILLALGLLLAIAFNVDTIALARHLSVTPEARTTLIRASAALTTKGQPVGSADVGAAAARLAAMQDQVEATGLPLGWTEVAVAKVRRRFQHATPIQATLAGLQLLLGYSVTALALSLGAPFWFDTLNTVMLLRSTVKPGARPRDRSDAQGVTPGLSAAEPSARSANAPAGAPAPRPRAPLGPRGGPRRRPIFP